MYIGKTRNPVVLILLSLVTCGIYDFFWIWNIMEDINAVKAESGGKPVIDNPILYLVLGIVCFPFYWMILYKVDKAMMEIAPQEGILYKSNFMMWVLLAFLAGVGGFFALFNLSESFNDLWAARAARANSFTPDSGFDSNSNNNNNNNDDPWNTNQY
jgi:hypothetical protein